MPQLTEVVQSLDLEAPIDLFKLEGLGLSPFYFSNLAGVVFAGISYTPVPCQFEWIPISSEGASPTSRLTVSDVSGYLGAIVEAYDNGFLGAMLTATRTYAVFLDNAPGADSLQYHDPVVLRVNKRIYSPGDTIEFECVTGFDLERKKIPGRAYLRRCGWVLSDENCRAPTNIHFDLAGNPIAPDQRACGKDGLACRRYHGVNFGKFIGSFPGVQRR